MKLLQNKFLVIAIVFLGILILPSVVDVQSSFAFRLGDADPFVNNMWLEPQNPNPGDVVSIHSSIYNQGTQSTKEVTDVVTIGYFINGALIKIQTLQDVRPGEENGIEVSTGPIWEATDGIHIITMILNYHDTLSHLTDNLENNIMQKKYHVGNWKNSSNSLISFETFQEALPNTDNQIVKIFGRINLPENYPEYRTPRIEIEFVDEKNSIQKYSTIVDRNTNSFYWRETIPISNVVVPITVSFSDERYDDFLYRATSNLHPVSLDSNESLLVLNFSEFTNSQTFKNKNFSVIVYDEFYNLVNQTETTQLQDYPIKEVETIQLPASPFKKPEPTTQSNPVFSTIPGEDLLYIILPGDKTYNFEIYSEDTLEYSSLKFLAANNVFNDVIESKHTYDVSLNQNESLFSLKLSDPTNSITFQNSEFIFVVFQDSYDHLFRQISTFEPEVMSYVYAEDFLAVLPANHKYIIEVYMEGRFMTSFETTLTDNATVNKQIFVPDSAQLRFNVTDALGNPLNDVYVESWIYSAISHDNGFTDWIEVMATDNGEPYTAKAIFSDGVVTRTEPFQIKSGESKTVPLIRSESNP